MNNTVELKQNNTFISNTYKKALIPCMLSVLSANINVIVDGILVGQKLGNNALAAINICLPVNLFLCIIGSLFSSGTAINASKTIGSNNKSGNGNGYYNAGIVLSYISSIIITFLGVFFINDICLFLCSNMAVYPYVREYALITLIGSIFRIMIYIPFWYLRLDGKNKQVSVIMSILTLGNIILDILFVFVFSFGVFGAGLANVIATAIAMTIGFVYLSDKESSFRFEFKLNNKHVSYKKIFTDGIPSSLNNLCSTIRILVINSMLLAAGGVAYVAVFTAVNGVFSIGECILLGIPQASTAMLGVYEGEKDYSSCRLIVKSELIIGAVYSSAFIVLCAALSGVVRNIYGLSDNLLIPLLFMSISIFPSLISNSLSGYYNISGRNGLSAIIIIFKYVIFTYVFLKLATLSGINIFSFYILSEIATLVFWFILTGVYYYRNRSLDRFLLCDMNRFKEGKVLNFSVSNNNEEICNASEKISDFCSNNGLTIKDTMKIQLAIEEALVIISQVNEAAKEELDGFDLRAFVYDETKGIRIRYDGLDFNPFEGSLEGSDYMGIKMISDMIETTVYKRTFGVNTLILLLKDNR